MRKLVNTVLAGALGLSMIAGVSAQSDNETAVVQVTAEDPGNVLTVVITGADFGEHPYSFEQQEPTATISVDVLDNRGTNVGWEFNLSAEGPLEGSDTGEIIPLSGLSLAAPVAVGPDPAVGQPADEIDTFAVNPVTTQGQTILAADEGEGAGEYDFEMEGTLVIPAGQIVDTYSTTLTVETPAAP